MADAVEEATEKELKRPRKLNKNINIETDAVEIEILGSENGVVSYPLSDLPPEMVNYCALHGLNQKLGDGAAGRTSEEAETNIGEIWEALKAGSWNTGRAVGERQFSKKAVMGKMEALSDADRDEVAAALAKIGYQL